MTIKRKMIQLNYNTAVLMQIFHRDHPRDDSFKYIADDFMLDDCPDSPGLSPEYSKEAAQQFISQLEEEYCDNFLAALIEECFESLLDDTYCKHSELADTVLKRIQERFKKVPPS